MDRPSSSAQQPANHWEDRSAERPGGHWSSLSLFARFPADIWRQLIGLLLYSDVAACSCSTSHEDTKRCCISTFKRLLVHYGAIIWDSEYGVQWDTPWWNNSEHRRDFWRVAIEMIFLYEPKLMQEGQRCDRLVQQDYIHSCGSLFACSACCIKQWQLQNRFRRFYGAPNHVVQPWFVNALGLWEVARLCRTH